MKNFLATIFLAVMVILFGSYDNRAEAQDIYMGTWRSGYDAYLMTETVNVISEISFNCTIKAVRGNSVMYIDYNFYWRRGGWRFYNSDGVDNAVHNGTSIEKNTWDFVERNYRF